MLRVALGAYEADAERCLDGARAVVCPIGVVLDGLAVFEVENDVADIGSRFLDGRHGSVELGLRLPVGLLERCGLGVGGIFGLGVLHDDHCRMIGGARDL